jgi:hypothetical protein
MNSQIESVLEESQEPLTARVESVRRRKTERARGGKIMQFNNNRRGTQQLRRERVSDKPFNVLCWVVALLIALSVAPTAMFAEEEDHEGGGGQVLPGTAKPRGFSLSDMARATAFFNTGDHSLATYPDTPFQILYVPQGGGPQPYTFEVNPGTMLYVPIFFSDDSPPIIGDFPNVNNRQAVLNYAYSPTELGTISMTIKVDGTMTSLGSDYLFAVGNVKLGDGPGTRYLGFAVFLTPLNKGTHTVKIVASLNGAPTLAFFGVPPGQIFVSAITYTVIVRDED